MNTGSVTIGFDIGGTNLRGGVVDAHGHIIDMHAIPTPRAAEGLEQGIISITQKLQREHNVQAIGVAVAGFLDAECSTVRFAPHLPWRDRNVKQVLEAALDMPVTLEHDANSAAWGEYIFGAARGARIWSLFSLGTGIGGAIMIDGILFRGAYGTAPEYGHLQVVPNGRPCACGKTGCLERYCSGTALVTTAMENASNFDSPLAQTCMRAPGQVTGHTIFDAAEAGDPLGVHAVGEFADWLGLGLGIVGDVIDPELIVLSGGVSTRSELYLSRAYERYLRTPVGSAHRPHASVKTAKLGAEAGMIGVAHLAAGTRVHEG